MADRGKGTSGRYVDYAMSNAYQKRPMDRGEHKALMDKMVSKYADGKTKHSTPQAIREQVNKTLIAVHKNWDEKKFKPKR